MKSNGSFSGGHIPDIDKLLISLTAYVFVAFMLFFVSVFVVRAVLSLPQVWVQFMLFPLFICLLSLACLELWCVCQIIRQVVNSRNS